MVLQPCWLLRCVWQCHARAAGPDGKLSKRESITWSDSPVQLGCCAPYAVALLPKYIEVGFAYTCHLQLCFVKAQGHIAFWRGSPEIAAPRLQAVVGPCKCTPPVMACSMAWSSVCHRWHTAARLAPAEAAAGDHAPYSNIPSPRRCAPFSAFRSTAWPSVCPLLACRSSLCCLH